MLSRVYIAPAGHILLDYIKKIHYSVFVKVVIEKKAAKYLESLDAVMKQRIEQALKDLAKEPPSGDIVKLQGKDGFRRRVGDYRIVFDITETNVIVYKIAPRGQAYKGD